MKYHEERVFIEYYKDQLKKYQLLINRLFYAAIFLLAAKLHLL